jgi:D-beta-D-heptose 7-phosphate kinase/D-beta-D-heptose 1-phosphate adenosyltransferase
MKILIIGEVCDDVFIYGDCKRLSPEAPVPVLNPIEIIRNKGMSGNVLNNLKSLDKSLNINQIFQNEKITKTRYVDKKSNHMFLRLDEGEENISGINLTNELLEKIPKYDIVIVSDYDKGFLNIKSLNIIGNLSKLSILDSKKILDDETISKFTFVKLNENEAKNNQGLKILIIF